MALGNEQWRMIEATWLVENVLLCTNRRTVMISFSTERINGPFRSGIGMLVLCRDTFFESESIVLSKLFADSRLPCVFYALWQISQPVLYISGSPQNLLNTEIQETTHNLAWFSWTHVIRLTGLILKCLLFMPSVRYCHLNTCLRETHNKICGKALGNSWNCLSIIDRLSIHTCRLSKLIELFASSRLSLSIHVTIYHALAIQFIFLLFIVNTPANLHPIKTLRNGRRSGCHRRPVGPGTWACVLKHRNVPASGETDPQFG